MTSQLATGLHDVLFYGTDDQLVDVVVPFLRGGLEADESALLVCGERKNALLSDALGGGDRVSVLAQTDVYRRPPSAIAAYTRFVEQQVAAGARRVRVIGELDSNARPDAWDEWIRYESVLNRAFAHSPVWVLCGYDTRTVPRRVLAGAEATHPNLVTAGTRTTNLRYVEPAEYLSRPSPNGQDPIEAGTPVFEAAPVTEVGSLRNGLKTALAGSGHGGQSTDAIVMAVNEVVSNALLYGAPPVRVRLWSSPERSVCTVTDGGAGFDDPFAGYLYATNISVNGRGLWLARQLCDTVRTSRNDDGFTVRLDIRH